MDYGTIIFISAAIGLIAVLIWPFIPPLPRIPGYNNVLLLLAAVAVSSAIYIAYTLPQWVASITLIGIALWILTPLFGFPRSLYKVGMIITVVGAVWTMLLVIL